MGSRHVRMTGYRFGLAQALLCAATLWFAGCGSAEPGNGDVDGGGGDNINGKIGVLFIGVGTNDEYDMEWAGQFFTNVYDFFPPGFFAGGELEGGDCYTLIHYANEAEAAVCGVPEETPIDMFCNVYENEDEYPVHALEQNSFMADCYNDMISFFVAADHSTIDPETGEEIEGPVVDDPNGAGIGIPDFLELTGFDRMDYFYRIPNQKGVHRQQLLKWWYGNDAKGYPTDSEEAINIKDALKEALPDAELVFRHGWESYMENVDIYGKSKVFPDSTKTAVEELINDEKVDRIVVFTSYPGFSNLTQYGHEWYDPGDVPISAVEGKTFVECVQDLEDGYGPETAPNRDKYLEMKPWDDHRNHPFPFIRKTVEELSSDVNVSFAPAYGEFSEFADSVTEMIKYTVEKFKISDDASLKVILSHHGYAGGYMEAQECDAYYRIAAGVFSDMETIIAKDFVWEGKFELVHAAGEYAEHENPMAPTDPVSQEKPVGVVISIGEEVEKGMNGQYVNQLGELIDNGTDNFEYIVVIPYYFESESSDTVFCKREHTFGNHSPHDLIPTAFVRDEHDSDGTEYNAGDVDDESFTMKLLDQSGWPGVPSGATDSVMKGSKTNPTTVIITSATLSLPGDSKARQKLTDAAVQAIRFGLNNANDGLCKTCE
ncbi:MAG: hypothetical protein GY854_15140 [Deltaproteobacteria bacterium]|nr:hypothetical protein [Deltaproteobacteria bacterium]